MPPKAKPPANYIATRAAPYEPKTLDAEKRTVDLVVTTEAPVMMYDWQSGEQVDEVLALSGMRQIAGNIPLLDAHQRGSVRNILGSLDTPRVQGDALTMRASFSSLAQAEFVKVQEGHLRAASAGYRVHAYTYVKPGQTAKVAGKNHTAQGRTLAVATDWELLEGSLVPIGADPNAGTRAAPGSTPQEAHMDPKLRAALEAVGLAQGATDEEAQAFMADNAEKIRAAMAPPPAPKAEPPPAPAAPADDGAVKLRAELERRDAIAASAKPYEADAKVRELREAAVRDNKSLDQFRAALLDHLAGAALPPSRVTVGREDREVRREGAVLGLMLRAAPHLLKDKAQQDQARAFCEPTMFNLCCRTLADAGVSIQGMNRLEIVQRAFHATGDFPYILANVMTKTLLAAYELAPRTWELWCVRGQLSDYKTAYRNKFGGNRVLSQVPEGADAPDHTVSEEREPIALAKYAEVFSYTEEMAVNDDLDALGRIPIMHANDWAVTVNQQPVKVLLANAALTDTVALFHSTHANLDTTTPAVTTKATADAVILALKLKLRQQTGLDGSLKLNLPPALLLCSPTKEDYFNQSLGAILTNADPAVVSARIKLVAEAELENTGLTGYGTNLSYLFAPKERAPIMEVSFLDGNDAPQTKTWNNERASAVSIMVKGAVAAAAIDFRGCAKHVA